VGPFLTPTCACSAGCQDAAANPVEKLGRDNCAVGSRLIDLLFEIEAIAFDS
jgi:hypothetical protein